MTKRHYPVQRWYDRDTIEPAQCHGPYRVDQTHAAVIVTCQSCGAVEVFKRKEQPQPCKHCGASLRFLPGGGVWVHKNGHMECGLTATPANPVEGIDY
jgi:hypothetical protein